MQHTERTAGKTRQTATQGMDIIDAILEDHEPLKELIEIMKDSEKPFDQRLDAFEEFAPLLIAHAKPEEETLYAYRRGGK